MKQNVNRKLFFISFIIIFLLVLYLCYILTFRVYIFSRYAFYNLLFVLVWVCILFPIFTRKPLDFYSEQCSDIIKSAFIYSQADRDELLSAIRLYDENKYKKAVKLLNELKSISKYNDDYYSVGILLGLCYSKMNLHNETMYEFNNLKEKGLDDATFYLYFGRAFSSFEHYVEASDCFEKAIEKEPDNPKIYFNLALLNFDLDNVMQAEYYAKKTLEKDKGYYHSISLLALIYAKRNDIVSAKSYYKQAVLMGEDRKMLKEKLKRIIREYKM